MSYTGQLPETTRKTITIDSTTAYSIKDYNQAFKMCNVVIVFLSMVLLCFTFWTDYSVYSPIFDYMQLMVAVFLVNVTLPPTPVYALGVFKYALFSFLPNMFSDTLPTAEYDALTMNGSVYTILKDFTFLRNMGQLYFILIVLVILLLATYGLSKKCFNKQVKTWCKKFIK